MLVKSWTVGDHLRNLSLIFGKLKKYNMRLIPSKCAFGKFLGFMISQRGIKANPEKIRELIDMQVPRTKKEVQRLTGRVAALARFISKVTDRCAPFFKALKGSKRQVDWTSECDRAFEDVKAYMSRAPLLSTPLLGEDLIIYLSILASALSSVLIRRPNGIKLPIFYMSHALQDAEQWYPRLENFGLRSRPLCVQTSALLSGSQHRRIDQSTPAAVRHQVSPSAFRKRIGRGRFHLRIHTSNQRRSTNQPCHDTTFGICRSTFG
ncbi:unnamed protein product [Prunus brigantina]